MKKISKIKSRILQYIEYKGINKRNFYLKTGISNGVLDKKTGLSEDNIEKFISTFPDVNPEWLLTGKGEMLRGEEEEEPRGLIPAEPGEGIPLIPTEAIAGAGGFPVCITPQMIEEWYRIPDFPNASYLIKVYGNSMQPTYNSGDILVCKELHDPDFIVWGKIYVFHHREHGAMAKRFFPGKKKGEIICRSDNSEEYPDFTIHLNDLNNLAVVLGGIKFE